jgi:hypothetical protein
MNGIGRKRGSLVVHVQIGLESDADEIDLRNRDGGLYIIFETRSGVKKEGKVCSYLRDSSCN